VEDLLRCDRLARKGQKYPTVWIPGKAVRAKKAASAAGEEEETPWANRRTVKRGSNLKRALELYVNRTAKKLKWKPYMVMHKKVIAQLDEKRPKSLEQLYEVDGLGPAKVDQFGWDLLDIVRRYDH